MSITLLIALLLTLYCLLAMWWALAGARHARAAGWVRWLPFVGYGLVTLAFILAFTSEPVLLWAAIPLLVAGFIVNISGGIWRRHRLHRALSTDNRT